MQKIEKPEEYEICVFDGVTASAVYLGGLSNLERVTVKLRWRFDAEMSRMCFDPAKVLTLKEITDQCKKLGKDRTPLITVMVESPLHGTILQYGNYGDEWWEIGTVGGYA